MFHRLSRTWMINSEHVRDALSEHAGPDRAAYAKRKLALVAAELAEIGNLLRPLAQAFRRAICSLEGIELPPDAPPTLRPGIEVKYRAAIIGHYAALVPDFALGLVVSRALYLLSWAWALGVGFFFVALALLSRLVAAVVLDRRDPARHVGPALAAVLAGWVVLLLTMLLTYLVRGGALPVGLVTLLVPVVWAAFLAQSVGFGVLAEAYSYAVKLYHRYRELIARKSELESLRDALEAELQDEGTKITASPVADGPTNGHGEFKAVGRSGRRSEHAAKVLGLALAIGCAFASGMAHSAPADERSVTRLVVAVDESPTGEDTPEFGRIRRLLADGLPGIATELPALVSITVLHWSDASTVWAGGKDFPLPRATRVVPLEARLEFFRKAVESLRAADDTRDHALQAPKFADVGREIMFRPSGPATQSCVSQLMARASGAPGSELWIVVTDLEDYHCPPGAAVQPGGARAFVIAIPQREGADTHDHLTKRIDQLSERFPGTLVVPSWVVGDAASLRRLANPGAGR